MKKRDLKIFIVVLLFIVATLLAFLVAGALQENVTLQSYVRSSGLLGVILVGIIGGFNTFVPIPPATFAPLFLESGLAPLVVVVGFVIGTTIADSFGYLLGWFGRGYVKDNHPRITKYLRGILKQHAALAPFIIFGYFCLAPLPNEVILIPLALSGYKYKKLLIPLILGNVIHHSIMVFGYAKLFSLFF